MNKAEKHILIQEERLHHDLVFTEKLFGEDSIQYRIALHTWAEFYKAVKHLGLCPLRYSR